MDPSFLRDARHDADGDRTAFGTPPSALWMRLQAAVQHVVAAMRPH